MTTDATTWCVAAHDQMEGDTTTYQGGKIQRQHYKSHATKRRLQIASECFHAGRHPTHQPSLSYPSTHRTSTDIRDADNDCNKDKLFIHTTGPKAEDTTTTAQEDGGHEQPFHPVSKPKYSSYP